MHWFKIKKSWAFYLFSYNYEVAGESHVKSFSYRQCDARDIMLQIWKKSFNWTKSNYIFYDVFYINTTFTNVNLNTKTYDNLKLVYENILGYIDVAQYFTTDNLYTKNFILFFNFLLKYWLHILFWKNNLSVYQSYENDIKLHVLDFHV